MCGEGRKSKRSGVGGLANRSPANRTRNTGPRTSHHAGRTGRVEWKAQAQGPSRSNRLPGGTTKKLTTTTNNVGNKNGPEGCRALRFAEQHSEFHSRGRANDRQYPELAQAARPRPRWVLAGLLRAGKLRFFHGWFPGPALSCPSRRHAAGGGFAAWGCFGVQ